MIRFVRYTEFTKTNPKRTFTCLLLSFNEYLMKNSSKEPVPAINVTRLQY